MPTCIALFGTGSLLYDTGKIPEGRIHSHDMAPENSAKYTVMYEDRNIPFPSHNNCSMLWWVSRGGRRSSYHSPEQGPQPQRGPTAQSEGMQFTPHVPGSCGRKHPEAPSPPNLRLPQGKESLVLHPLRSGLQGSGFGWRVKMEGMRTNSQANLNFRKPEYTLGILLSTYEGHESHCC